ncbi:uncharacterized protein LOC127245175 [Andrographis paniculata]|uniref:uncharacterized protein LOC127245175 n=1 Tax=Andrographis paniculata TaxID=175694 RepID=UPI0021E895A4|nr:uncharacterized protein LOC127245175 [Andrographis paniculata]
MRKLFPNHDREDALETVLEVPIPEEIFTSNKHKPWQHLQTWTLGPQASGFRAAAELQFLLGVVGAPLIPLPIPSDRTLNNDIRNSPIERSMAKYIVQQYIAAAGGEHALNSIDSMHAVGKVKMAASEFVGGEELRQGSSKALVKSMKHGPGEIGGFVLWQRRPDLWSLELVVSGCKITAGSDGNVAWRQTPWHNSHASRGPPRPLRRSLQGLDPRLIANLFSNAVCTGEKTINGQDCFVLKLEAESLALKARSSPNVEIVRHTIWGYFSQRTGLLIQLHDSHLLRTRASGNNVVCWETTTESLIQDYRTIEGVNIAHLGRTSISLLRFGESSERHTRTRMEEIWSIEEVDFNIKGLRMECFLAPSDLKREDEEECGGSAVVSLPCRGLNNSCRTAKGARKVVAVEEQHFGVFQGEQRL